MGRNRSMGLWKDWKALQTLMLARLLHPCPDLPQQDACPLLFTGMGTLPPCSKHSCHSSACTPKLPAPQCTLHPCVLCSPVHPAPPCNLHPLHPMCPSPCLPSSPPSPQLPESRASQPPSQSWEEAGGGQCWAARVGVALGCTLKTYCLIRQSISAHPRTPLPAPARSLLALCFCLHTLGFLKTPLSLRQACT